MAVTASSSFTKDYRVILYGLFSCVHYGWDVCAGRKWQQVPFLVFRAVSHLGLFLLFQHDTRPHAVEAVRIATALFLLLGVWEKIQEMPIIWDSDSWSIQMDTTMGLWLLSHSYIGSGGKRTMLLQIQHEREEDAVDDVAFHTIRDMFANYYFAAAFWKVNSHFLDSDASCATMFIVQLVVNYIRPLLMRSSWLFSGSKTSLQDYLISIASVAKKIAPVSALIVELAVGGCMLLGSLVPFSRSDGFHALGSLSSLLFHLMVCMLPAPNDISGFALNCAARHIVFATALGTHRAWNCVQDRKLTLLTTIVVGIAMGVQSGWTENNWAFFLYLVVGGFVSLSLVLGGFFPKNKMIKVEESGKKEASQLRPVWSLAAVGVAFLYSFGTLILGLQEESTANMFANLKSGHGGSNHYILPTGLLFHWYGDASNSHPFGGGVIRIENTTSAWLRTIYPADFTQFLEPDGLIDVMTAIGNPPPIYFNPGANRNLGLVKEVPARFYRYTVPALEFKRLLREAKERDRDFVLTYSKLIGTRGDEIWRAKSIDKVVTIDVREGELHDCKVYYHSNEGDSRWTPCEPSELPYVNYSDSVPWILRRMSLYHAYPIVVDENEDESKIPMSIRCFGP
jgi:hypothetical protein